VAPSDEHLGRLAYLKPPPNNGMHPTADMRVVKFLLTLGATGDAGRCGAEHMTKMRRRLSAVSTPFWKFIFPALWVGSLIINAILDIGRLLNLFAVTRGSLTGRAVGGYTFLLIGSVILYKVLGVLKRVEVDDSHLYVSNYLKEVRVPLSDVEYVDGPEHSSHQRFKIYLRSPTAFGDVVVFMPGLLAGRETRAVLQDRLNALQEGVK
jgi:hypothetical protein